MKLHFLMFEIFFDRIPNVLNYLFVRIIFVKSKFLFRSYFLVNNKINFPRLFYTIGLNFVKIFHKIESFQFSFLLGCFFYFFNVINILRLNFL